MSNVLLSLFTVMKIWVSLCLFLLLNKCANFNKIECLLYYLISFVSWNKIFFVNEFSLVHDHFNFQHDSSWNTKERRWYKVVNLLGDICCIFSSGILFRNNFGFYSILLACKSKFFLFPPHLNTWAKTSPDFLQKENFGTLIR